MPWMKRYPGIAGGLKRGRRYSVGVKPLTTRNKVTAAMTAKNGFRTVPRRTEATVTDSGARTFVVMSRLSYGESSPAARILTPALEVI